MFLKDSFRCFRRLIAICFIILPAICQSQEPLSYTGIVQVDSASKEQLFNRARTWFNESFKSSKDVLQINDKESGELSGKGITTLTVTYKYLGTHNYSMQTYFLINVWVKDNKYKYEIKNFDTSDPLNNASIGILSTAEDCPVKWRMCTQKMMNEVWVTAKESASLKAKELISSLSQYMTKNDQSKNW